MGDSMVGRGSSAVGLKVAGSKLSMAILLTPLAVFVDAALGDCAPAPPAMAAMRKTAGMVTAACIHNLRGKPIRALALGDILLLPWSDAPSNGVMSGTAREHPLSSP